MGASATGLRLARRALCFTLVLTGAVVAGGAGAGAESASGSASPENVQSNQQVTLSGTGFKPSTEVLAIDGDGAFAQGTGTADGNGAVSIPVTASAGLHQVRLTGVNPAGTPRVAWTVYTGRPSCFNNCGSLPRTGFPLLPALPIGVGLVAVGAGVVALRRRGVLAPVAGRVLSVATVLACTGVSVVALAPPSKAQTTGTTTTTFAQPASVAGTVTDATSNAGIGGVCVRAYSDVTYGAATTASDGTYTISGLTTDVIVAFADCNTAPAHIPATQGHQGLAAGQNKTGVNQALTRAGFLDGTAKPSSGDVAPTGCAFVGLDSDQGEQMHCASEVGATGAYVSDLVVPGDYIVGFAARDDGFPYAVTYSGNAADPVSASAVTAAAGETGVPAVTLSPEGTISGHVSDGASGGAPTRCVSVYDRVGDVRTLASSFADSSAPDYTIRQAHPGTNKVEFADCGFEQGTPYPTKFYNGKADVASADPVTVAAGQDTVGIDAAMGTDGPAPTTTSTTAAPGATTTTTTAPGATTTTTSAGPPAPPVAGATTTTTTAAGAGPTTTGQGQVSDGTVTPGEAVTITGGGFAGGSDLTVTFFSSPISMGTITADAAGNYSARVTIPQSAPAGNHTIVVSGPDAVSGTREVRTAVVVQGSSSGGTLPLTGADALRLAAWALCTVVLGLALRRGARAYLWD
jgi:hypothetical protein